MFSSQKAYPNWYVVYTRPHYEKKISRALDRAGIIAFLPLIKEQRIWSDRIKTVTVPLLPNYLFVRLESHRTNSVFAFPGVLSYVSLDGKPVIIRSQEIEYLREVVKHGNYTQSTTNFDLGEEVKIVRGPLKGWEGRLTKKMGRTRVTFQITGIRQAMCIEVQAGDIEKIGSTTVAGPETPENKCKNYRKNDQGSVKNRSFLV